MNRKERQIAKLRTFGEVSNKQTMKDLKMNIKSLFTVFIVSLLLFNCSGTAHCKTVVSLGKGDIATYKGYLFTPEMEKKARIALEENYQYKILVTEQYENLVLQGKMIENRNRIIGELNGNIEDNKFYNILYFVGGAVIGGLVTNELRR